MISVCLALFAVGHYPDDETVETVHRTRLSYIFSPYIRQHSFTIRMKAALIRILKRPPVGGLFRFEGNICALTAAPPQALQQPRHRETHYGTDGGKQRRTQHIVHTQLADNAQQRTTCGTDAELLATLHRLPSHP